MPHSRDRKAERFVDDPHCIRPTATLIAGIVVGSVSVAEDAASETMCFDYNPVSLEILTDQESKLLVICGTRCFMIDVHWCRHIVLYWTNRSVR